MTPRSHMPCPNLTMHDRVSWRDRSRFCKSRQPFILLPAEKVGPAQRRARAIVTRFEVRGILRLIRGLPVPAGAQERRHHVHSMGVRIQLLRTTLQRDRLVVAPEASAQPPV